MERDNDDSVERVVMEYCKDKPSDYISGHRVAQKWCERCNEI